ncbi:DMT family transporter [Jeotgalicoccus psychrophilus]|uniref:DMT family transporter n=2 Tax=Jeotgalicoccus TaxID=227979 RepID=UPI0003F6DD61|nr:DMT family transporter [Jeotgalicoccus psychrophilus]
MKKNKNMLIYLLVFTIMVLWGLNIVILKLLVTELPPATMTAFRVMIAGVTTLCILMLTRSFRRMTKQEWIYTLLGTLFGVVLHHSLLAISLTMIDASSAALILALVPLTTVILAIFFLGEKLTGARLLGIFLALIGVFFIQGESFTSFHFSLGEVLIFTSMLVQAISFIFIKKATATIDSKQITTMMFLTGSIGLVILSFIIEPGSFSQMFTASPFIYVLFIFSGMVVTGFGYIIYNSAIQQIGAGQTVIFNNFVPFFGVVFSVIFLNEMITASQVIGFIFVVIGVLFGTGYIEFIFSQRNRRKNL